MIVCACPIRTVLPFYLMSTSKQSLCSFPKTLSR